MEEGTEVVPPIVAGGYYKHRYLSFHYLKVVDETPNHLGQVKVHDGVGETWANPLHLYLDEED